METSQSISHNQQPLKCGSLLSRLLSLLSLCWLQFPVTPQYVSQAASAGRVAFEEYVSNRNHVVGFGFGVVGFCSIALHTFFDPSIRDYSWFYINWFYFIETLRFWICLSLFSTAIYFHCPSKHRVIWVVYGIVLSIGVGGVIHYSFFTNSFETYHSLNWFEWLLAPATAFSFVLAIKNLHHRKYHIKDGSFCRIVGMIKAPGIDAETKIKHLETTVTEIENFNARY